MLESYHGYSVDPWGHVSKNIAQSVRLAYFATVSGKHSTGGAKDVTDRKELSTSWLH